MFIVVEGIDGAGTTTQSKNLAQWFTENDISAHLTFEPSDGRIGKLIREYLSGKIDAPDVDRHFHSLALLFAADRLDHLCREVEPRLEKGETVISDRYVLSSLVYQSLHCDPEWVASINGEAAGADVTFLLDLPVECAMERLARRSLFSETEIYETEEQQQRLRELYLKAARNRYADQDIVIIDASQSQQEVFEAIIKKLKPRLKAFTESGGESTLS